MAEAEKVHFQKRGESYPVCWVFPDKKCTLSAKDVTCLSCIYKMRKAGVEGTPGLEVAKPGRRQGTKVRRPVHAIDCDMDEDCTCLASFKAGRG